MQFELAISNNGNNKDQIKKLMQGFVDKKTKQYMELDQSGMVNVSDDGDITAKKYLASLWMVSSLIGVQKQHEIAEQLNISYTLMQSWENDTMFKTLVNYNYREFLIYIVDLLA